MAEMNYFADYFYYLKSESNTRNNLGSQVAKVCVQQSKNTDSYSLICENSLCATNENKNTFLMNQQEHDFY